MSSMLLAAAAAALFQTQAEAPAPDPNAPTVTADQALDNYRKLVGSAVPPKIQTCPDAPTGEIVVCARSEDPKTQHVPSDTDLGSTDDGIPHAPDVSGLPSCAGATMCAQHLGRKPRQLYIIDLKAIPEPPAGSDADKIAKGEMAAP
jgi:hypothetical protein